MASITIRGKTIDSDGVEPYVVAEIGCNHCGDFGLCLDMIRSAAACGADAVKLQKRTNEELFTPAALAEPYRSEHAYGPTYGEHRAALDWFGYKEFVQAADLARSLGLAFIATPFTQVDAEFLTRRGIEVDAFKIASCDLTNTPLIEHCSRYGKPLYISTGMGSLAEARQACESAAAAGSPKAVLLQCTTNYPTAHQDVNLLAMCTLKERIGCHVGFSDHSIGNWACYAAVALGAEVIEKHFCLDKAAEGPDIPGSCGADELSDLLAGNRAIELALGDGEKAIRDSEREMATVARRSIYYAGNFEAGHVLTPTDLRFLRPAGGMSPARTKELLGRTLARAVQAGDAAHPADVA